MAKILVSDLMGTLVSDNILLFHHLYGKCIEKTWDNIFDDKEYHKYLMDKFPKQCINVLDKFLNDGNVLYIVSDLSSHECDIKFILDRIIGSLHKYSNNDFNVFLVKTGGCGNFDLDSISNKITSKYTEDGVDYFIYDGYSVGIIDEKKDVFNVILSKYNIEENELLSIGNSGNDIPMLVKCMELGGKSSLLDYLLYQHNNITLEEALDKYFRVLFHIKKEKEILNNFPNYSELSNAERKKIEDAYYFNNNGFDFIKEGINYKNEILPLLYEKMRQGNLSKDFLIKQYLIFEIFKSFCYYKLEKKTLIENNWDKIDMYSTFSDYYNKILSTDSKKLEKAPQFVKVQKQSNED